MKGLAMPSSEAKRIDPKFEKIKSYWNSRPCNIGHSAKPVGSKEYFAEVRAKKYFVEGHIPSFAEFDRWKGKKVLEIGCGIGSATTSFALAGARVTAVDLSRESLKVAELNVKVSGCADKVRFYEANAEQLSMFIPVEKYDLVYSFGVIHHTVTPENVLAEIRQFCHPGTEVRVMVYHRWSWKVLLIFFKYGKGRFWRLVQLVARYSEAQLGCPVTYTYTVPEVRRMLKRNGFSLVRAEIHHIFPYKFPEYTQNKYVRVWYFRFIPDLIFGLMERFLGWHLCFVARPR